MPPIKIIECIGTAVTSITVTGTYTVGISIVGEGAR